MDPGSEAGMTKVRGWDDEDLASKVMRFCFNNITHRIRCSG